MTFLSRGKSDIDNALNKINGFDPLRDCFFGHADLNTVVHPLMHYRPDNNPVFAALYPASKSIERMLYDRLDKILDDNVIGWN
jgi:hypothetical protein